MQGSGPARRRNYPSNGIQTLRTVLVHEDIDAVDEDPAHPDCCGTVEEGRPARRVVECRRKVIF